LQYGPYFNNIMCVNNWTLDQLGKNNIILLKIDSNEMFLRILILREKVFVFEYFDELELLSENNLG
jgi:hypothetical protein